MTSMAKWSAALLLAVCVSAHAAPDAQVEAMQMPAWVERDGQRSPLEVGAALRNGDRIETGLASRIVLRLADGSTVKLGENARFELADMQRAATARGIFKATLSVIEGAFRFTTAAIYKFNGQREINVRFHIRNGRDPRHRSVGKVDCRSRHRLPDRGAYLCEPRW
jgi:hypothetical protein